MATADFTLEGFDGLGALGDQFKGEVKRQVSLASKAGISMGADFVAYGRTSSPKPNNISSNSAVALAAKALRVPTEHIFYRTFVRAVKVSVNSSRGAKPFASVMLRGNSINVVDLLVRGDDAKKMYGYSSRRRNVSGRVKPNMKSRADAARKGGRRSGRVVIYGREYTNAYIEDGTTRARSDAMENHYVNKLGAKPNSGLKGERYFLFQKRDKGQKLPYPAKAVKIDSKKVTRALDLAASVSLRRHAIKINELQTQEIHKRLKKLGFELK